MDADIDDDVLSYFTNDIESDNGEDSADELLDKLCTSDPARTSVDKNESDSGVDNEENDGSDHEVDEDTKAEIAALQAQIELLKSKKSPKDGNKKQKKNKVQVNKDETCPQNKSLENGRCKHGAPITQCVICCGKPNVTNVTSTSSVTCKPKDNCKHGKVLSECFFCSQHQVTMNIEAKTSNEDISNEQVGRLAEKIPKDRGKKHKTNKVQVNKDETCPQNKSLENGCCKHGAPITQCFFCSGKPNPTDVPGIVDTSVSNVACKPKDNCKHGKMLSKCFFCSQTQDTMDVEANAVTKEAISNVNKPKLDDVSERSRPRNILDVLPTIEGKSTTEFSKKRRVARDSKEVEDGGTSKKKLKVDGKEGEDGGTLKKKVKVEQKVNATTTKSIEMTEKGNAQFFGGVEVSKPVMSSIRFDEKIKGRELVKISKIETKIKGHDIEGDWVTVGVLVKRVTQKQSASGKNFCVWHLSDLCLGTENNVVALFLFGDSYKEHWKIQVGRVIALLNANLMKQDAKYSNQSLAISIDNPKKLMELGDSKYLGGCKGTRKSDGKPCSMYINKKHGEFCEYHVQAAFKRAKSGRMDLQSGGRAPRSKGKMLNNIKRDISEGVFYYGGQTVTLKEEKKVKGNSVKTGNNDCSALKSVMGIQVRIQAAKEYNEMKLKRQEEAKLQKDSTASSFLRQNRNELLNLTSKVATVGKTGVEKADKLQCVAKADELHGAPATKCVTKEEKKEAQRNDEETKKDKDKKAGMCDLEFFQKSESPEESPKFKANLKSAPVLGRGFDNEKSAPVLGRGFNNGKSAPVLGRGFNKGNDFIELVANSDDFCYEKHTGEEPLTLNDNTFQIIHPKKTFDDSEEDVARKETVRSKEVNMQARNKAISIIKANGPIQLEDPNTDTAKKKAKPLEIIEKRVDLCDKSPEEKSKRKKKSMLAGILGEIDLNSSEGKQLLQKKSKHVGALKLAEAEKEEKYFDSMEKKENMHEKMTKTFEIKVSGIACRECQYLAESQSELCRNLGHAVAKIPNMMKRFFMCKSCKTRCCAYNKFLPKKACTRCGEMNFEKTPMVMEKKGPLMGAETLEIRGREQKYVIGF